jgi:hypothetical protein
MSGGDWLDQASWRSALERFGPSLADVYFSHDYHDLYERNGDGRAVCFAADVAGAQLLVPGLRVSLPHPNSAVADLQSCNGYGGPLAPPAADSVFLERAWASFREAARGERIVATLFRLHPLLGNRRCLPADAVIRRERKTVFVDLTRGPTAAWEAADSRHRNMVSKARRAGAEVTWNAAGNWDAFVALYRPAMARLHAPSALNFSDAYFAALRQLADAEVAILEDEAGPAAGAVFLHGATFAHYHLAARRSDAPSFATNMVLQSAVERAAARGLAGMHLGGGTTNATDDPLLRFKRSMSTTLLDYEVALVVCDEPAYRSLLESWSSRAGKAPSWLLGYRQPLDGG